MLDKILEKYQDEVFYKADGFDNAIIGVEDNSMRLVYSINKCIRILVEEGMEVDEAVEYFYFNVCGAYIGDKTPIWCDDID